jgi:hypothetical protein
VQEAGLSRDSGEGQLTDELIGVVVAVGAVRPARPTVHGSSWEALAARKGEITRWVGQDLTLVKVGELLGRSGTFSRPTRRISATPVRRNRWSRERGTRDSRMRPGFRLDIVTSFRESLAAGPRS